MPNDDGNCPVCNRTLRKKGIVITAIVPDGAKVAPSPPGAEVLGRGRMRRQGGEIVQDIHIWDGTYNADWPPFCSVTCAARYGVDLWASGVRPGHKAVLAPPPRDTQTEAQGWAGLLSGMAEGQVERLPRVDPEHVKALEAPRLSPPQLELTPPGFPRPGDPEWHPPGKPPPVPGVFRYNRIGKRLNDSPDAQQRRSELMRRIRLGPSYIPPAHMVRGAQSSEKSSSGSGWNRLRKLAGSSGAASEARVRNNMSPEEWKALPHADKERLRYKVIQERMQAIKEQEQQKSPG